MDVLWILLVHLSQLDSNAVVKWSNIDATIILSSLNCRFYNVGILFFLVLILIIQVKVLSECHCSYLETCNSCITITQDINMSQHIDLYHRHIGIHYEKI